MRPYFFRPRFEKTRAQRDIIIKNLGHTVRSRTIRKRERTTRISSTLELENGKITVGRCFGPIVKLILYLVQVMNDFFPLSSGCGTIKRGAFLQVNFPLICLRPIVNIKNGQISPKLDCILEDRVVKKL